MKAMIPNFSNLTAVIMHRADGNIDSLVNQLRRLNIHSACQWPPRPKDLSTADLVFFDVDNGFDGMFPWQQRPPVPVIALVGSETPGRLEWAIDQRPSSYLMKPIGSKGVFQALVTAFHAHGESLKTEALLLELRQRLRDRPIVFQVILRLMKQFDVDDDRAFRILRDESMRRQLTIEACSQQLVVLADLRAAIPAPARSASSKPAT